MSVLSGLGLIEAIVLIRPHDSIGASPSSGQYSVLLHSSRARKRWACEEMRVEAVATHCEV